MPPKIIDWKRVNPETDINFGNPRQGAGHDGYSIPITVKDPDDGIYKPFLHQSPVLRIPFGMTLKQQKYGVKASCDVVFPGVVTNQEGDFEGPAEIVDYLTFLLKVEHVIKQSASVNSKVWFKKEIPLSVVEEFYFHNIMLSKQPEKYSPVFSTGLRVNDDGSVFYTQFYDSTGKPKEFKDISKGSNVILLLNLASIWLAGKSFGAKYKNDQIVVLERDTFKGCAIEVPPELVQESFDDEEMETDETGAASVPEFNFVAAES